MIPFHGTPIGSYHRNKDVLRGINMVLTWTTYSSVVKGARTHVPTKSGILHARLANALLLDCGAFPFWRAQKRNNNPKPLDFQSVIKWYREMMIYNENTNVIMPDVIEGGEYENDMMLERFPLDLVSIAWPVWHTEESIHRLIRLARKYGKICIGPMGRHSHVTGKAYTERMIEVFNAITRDAYGTKIHALRGLQLAGGPFPFDQADSTDAGRNHSQTPQKLEACLRRWNRRCANTAKSWSLRLTSEVIYHKVSQTSIFEIPSVHRWLTDTLRTPA